MNNKDLSKLKKELTPMQYEVTQNNATEPPFKNEFWNENPSQVYLRLKIPEKREMNIGIKIQLKFIPV